MGSLALKHLIWKERQFLTPIWIGLALLFLLANGLFLIFGETSSRADSVGMLTGLSILFGCVFGLATGIFLFSPEREQGTDQFLINLPISSAIVTKAKLLTGCALFVTFQLFLMGAVLVTHFFAQGDWAFFTEVPQGHQNIYSVLLLWSIPAECFLWSSLCSLIWKKPLNATFAAAGLALVSLLASSFLFEVFGIRVTEAFLPIAMIANRAIVSLLLLVAVLAVGRTWLRNPISQPTLWAIWRPASAKGTPRLLPSNPYRVLVWHTWKNSRAFFLMVLLGCLLYCIFGLNFFSGGSTRRPSAGQFQLLVIMQFQFAGIAGILLGLQSFIFDQAGKNYLFFQQQGSYPRKLWISRMILIALGALAAIVVCQVINQAVQSRFQQQLQFADNNWLQVSLTGLEQIGSLKAGLVFLAAAAAAQFCSMFVRSPILALPTAILTGVLSGAWMGYLVVIGASDEFGRHLLVPVLFGGPVVVSMFVATWWYAPHWISGRRPIVNTCTAIAGVAVVIAVTVLGLCQYRLAPPTLQTSILPLEQQKEAYQKLKSGKQPEGKGMQAARLYLDALKEQTSIHEIMDQLSLKDTNSKIDVDQPSTWPTELLYEFVVANEAAVALVVEASRQPTCHMFLNPESRVERGKQRAAVWRLLTAATEYQLKSGELEQALSLIFAEMHTSRHTGSRRDGMAVVTHHLTAWAGAKNQTEARLLDAMEELDVQFEKSIKDHRAMGLDLHYLSFREWLEDWESGRPTEANFSSHDCFAPIPFPWEVQRSLHKVERQIIEAKRKAETATELHFHPKMYWPHGTFQWRYFYSDRQGIYGGSDHTNLFRVSYYDETANRLLAIQLARYLKIRLALAAYRMKNGDYPEMLSQLSDIGLDAVPVDVFSGHEFTYSPRGRDRAVFFSSGYSHPLTEMNKPRETASYFIQPNQPFLVPWFSQEQGPATFQLLSTETLVDNEKDIVNGYRFTSSHHHLSQSTKSIDFALPK